MPRTLAVLRIAALRRAAFVLTVPLALAALVTCSDSRTPTAAREPDHPSLNQAQDVESNGVTAQGTIPLPINQSFNGSATALRINQAGTGQTADFRITNTRNAKIALLAQTAGTGRAFTAFTTGTGEAARIEANNTNSYSPALQVITRGHGPAISAVGRISAGSVSAGVISAAGGGFLDPDMFVGNNTSDTDAPSGNWSLLVGNLDKNGVYVETKAGAANAPVVFSARLAACNSWAGTSCLGGGWAGHFRASGAGHNGVLIETDQGSAGLQVYGGTKNAVVATTTGARALYTEESTEVWFTDYGLGKLVNGRARILLDATIAQTVSTDEPYHVFFAGEGRRGPLRRGDHAARVRGGLPRRERP